MTFAKLFDTAQGQLLVFTDESDEGEPRLNIRCDIGGINMTLSPVWDENDAGYDARDAALEAFSQDDADKHASEFAATLAKVTA